MFKRLRPPEERLQRQWWWLVAVWLAAGAVLAVLLWLERDNVEARERRQLAHQASTIHDNLVGQLKAVNHVLASLMDDLPRWRAIGNGQALASYRLRTFSDALTSVRTLSVLDAGGTVYASSRPELVGRNLQERDYFVAARRAPAPDTLVVSAPFKTVLGVWAINLTRAVPAPGGGFGGVVTATLDPVEFNLLLESVRYAPDMLTTLAHGEGLRFLIVPATGGSAGVNLAQPGTLFQRHMDSGHAESVLRGAMEPDGPQRLMAIHTIRPPELKMDRPLVTGAGRDWHMVFAEWRAWAWGLGALYLLAGAGAAAMLVLMQRRRRDIWRREAALAAQSAALQARWRAVLEATNQGVWERNLQTGKVYLSAIWKAMLGYGEDELGDDLHEWESRLHPDDRERVLAELQQHCAGAVPIYESVYRMRCKGGEYRWVQDRGRAIERDAAGQALRLVGTYADITDERRHQETMGRLTENLPGMLFQFQLDADGHRHLPYVSQGALEVFGAAPEALREDVSPLFDCIHPDDQQRVADSVAHSARELSVWQLEYRVVLPGRGERWLSGQSRPRRTDAGAVLWYGYVVDVTDTKRQSIQLQETERLLQHLMNEMPIGLCMVDAEGRIYFRNRRFVEMLGHTEASVPTMAEWRLKAYPDPAYRQQAGAAWRAAMEHAAGRGGDIPDRIYQITTHTGVRRAISIGGLTFGGNFLATFMDRTDDEAQAELLRKLAYVDGLTGVANRRHFDQTLQTEWRHCLRTGRPLALLLIDIDHFKQYNDLYGHQQGDECLRALGALLHERFGRSHDLAARYGGEEFVCLLPECDLDGARASAQALCEAVRALGMEHRGSHVAPVVTISVGVASQVPQANTAPESLLARADANLYRAKSMGRNRVYDGRDDLQKP